MSQTVKPLGLYDGVHAIKIGRVRYFRACDFARSVVRRGWSEKIASAMAGMFAQRLPGACVRRYASTFGVPAGWYIKTSVIDQFGEFCSSKESYVAANSRIFGGMVNRAKREALRITQAQLALELEEETAPTPVVPAPPPLWMHA